MTKIQPGRFYALRQQTKKESYWAFAIKDIEEDTIMILEYKDKSNEWVETLRSKSRMNLVVEIDKIFVLPLHAMKLHDRRKVVRSILDRIN